MLDYIKSIFDFVLSKQTYDPFISTSIENAYKSLGDNHRLESLLPTFLRSKAGKDRKKSLQVTKAIEESIKRDRKNANNHFRILLLGSNSGVSTICKALQIVYNGVEVPENTREILQENTVNEMKKILLLAFHKNIPFSKPETELIAHKILKLPPKFEYNYKIAEDIASLWDDYAIQRVIEGDLKDWEEITEKINPETWNYLFENAILFADPNYKAGNAGYLFARENSFTTTKIRSIKSFPCTVLDTPKIDPTNMLPINIWMQICSNLDMPTISSLTRVNKQMKHVLSDQSLWQYLFMWHFPAKLSNVVDWKLTFKNFYRGKAVNKNVTSFTLNDHNPAQIIDGSVLLKLQPRRWLSYFEDCTAIIYVIDISTFDVFKHKENMLFSQIREFEKVANSWYLEKHTTRIVWLNKVDRLKIKLTKCLDITEWLTDYPTAGPISSDEYLSYIQKKITETTTNDVYIYKLCGIDLDNVKAAMDASRELCLRSLLS